MTILCYHAVDPDWEDVLSVPPDTFAAHCDWLAANRRVVDLPEALEGLGRGWRPPRSVVALTFDDGFSSLYDHVLPLLVRHGFPATVFLVARTLTGEPSRIDWVDRPVPPSLATLTAGQVLEMQEAGVRFASHSYHHHDLTTLGHQELLDDLRASREVLEDLLGRAVPFLAYPRGRHDEGVRRGATRAGYSHAFSLPEGREARGAHAVPRVGVFPGNGAPVLRVKTSPAYLTMRTNPLFPRARALWPGRSAP